MKGGFTTNCVRELNGPGYSIRLTDLHNLRVCYKVAHEYADHLDRGLSTKDEISHARDVDGEQTEVEAGKDKAKKMTY